MRILSGMSVREYLELHRAGLTPSEMAYVSMADGLGGLTAEAHEFSESEPVVECYVGGSLVTVRPKRPQHGTENVGGDRSDVLGFSSASRRRLMRTIAKTERENRPLFVTLTYPDLFDQDMLKWKRDIDAFGKRFRRIFPDASFIWRIEFKSRRSGSMAGEVCPHWHLLVWNVDIVRFRGFADNAWYEVVGSGEASHLLAGVSSERMRKWSGTMRYVSKYVAKTGIYPEGWKGRAWGVVNRDLMPWAVLVTMSVPNEVAIRAVRVGRKMLKMSGKTLVFGLTWLINSETLLNYLEIVLGYL